MSGTANGAVTETWRDRPPFDRTTPKLSSRLVHLPGPHTLCGTADDENRKPIRRSLRENRDASWMRLFGRWRNLDSPYEVETP